MLYNQVAPNFPMTFSEYGLAAPSLAVLILLVFNCSKKRTKVVGKSQNPLYVLVPPFPAKRYLEEIGAGLFFFASKPIRRRVFNRERSVAQYSMVSEHDERESNSSLHKSVPSSYP